MLADYKPSISSAFVFLLVLAPGTCGDDKDQPVARPITAADSVIAVLYHDPQLDFNNDPVRAIFLAWPDGTVIWSLYSERGGPPYRVGRVEPKRFAAFIENIERSGICEDKALQALSNRAVHFGSQSIFIVSGKCKLEMESTHKLSRGKSEMRNITKLSTLKGASKLSLIFMLVWEEIRDALVGFMTIESKPITGRVVRDKENFQLIWQEK